MEIADGARKHGIRDEDMLPLFAIPHESSRARAEISSSAQTGSGRLLEVVVLDDDPDEEPIVIHAMPLRPKFHRFLR